MQQESSRTSRNDRKNPALRKRLTETEETKLKRYNPRYPHFDVRFRVTFSPVAATSFTCQQEVATEGKVRTWKPERTSHDVYNFFLVFDDVFHSICCLLLKAFKVEETKAVQLVVINHCVQTTRRLLPRAPNLQKTSTKACATPHERH